MHTSTGERHGEGTCGVSAVVQSSARTVHTAIGVSHSLCVLVVCFVGIPGKAPACLLLHRLADAL